MPEVFVTKHKPHPLNKETVTVVFPPEGMRTYPKTFSLTDDEVDALLDALLEKIEDLGDA